MKRHSAVVAAICICLAGLVWVVFGQTRSFSFVDYDDGTYVLENPFVRSGLNAASVTWAFTHRHGANWHPLTTLSHMLDCQLFGVNPHAHHLTNVLWHGATVLLLFFALRNLTGAMWRSAFVAAVFAIHPLRAESVAWISERKDVLSGFFFAGMLLAYAWYARRQSLGRYLAVGFLLICGLMSKPMLVTAPFVLLLLDYWPLNRFRNTPSARLVVEKLPLIAVTLVSAVITLRVQRYAIEWFEPVTLGGRVAQVLFSYCTYIGQMFWPTDMAAFYPHATREVNWAPVAAALAFLVMVSVFAWLIRRRMPYVFSGWFW